MSAPCPHCSGSGVTREARRTLYEAAVSVASTCLNCVGTGLAMTFHEQAAEIARLRAEDRRAF